MEPRCLGQQLGDRLQRRRQLRHQDLPRDGGRVRVGRVDLVVQLKQEGLDQGVGAAVVHPVGHPAALAADPPTPDVEDLHGHLERVLGERDHVGVGAVLEDHRVAIHGLAQGPDVIAQPTGPFELEVVAGAAHLGLEPLHVRGAVAGHERAEVLDDVPVGVRVDPPDAGRRALADVAEQARPTDLLVVLEHARAAGPHREHPQQLVHGLPDRPGVRVGAEVAVALALRPAPHHHPRELLGQRDAQPGVRLVVAVLDVEPGVELLDPGELELQRLGLGLHDGPLDLGRTLHHRPGPVVQSARIPEVGIQARPQALGLADVDDPVVRVREAIDPRLLRNRSRSRTVGDAGCHAVSLGGPSDIVVVTRFPSRAAA